MEAPFVEKVKNEKWISLVNGHFFDSLSGGGFLRKEMKQFGAAPLILGANAAEEYQCGRRRDASKLYSGAKHGRFSCREEPLQRFVCCDGVCGDGIERLLARLAEFS